MKPGYYTIDEILGSMPQRGPNLQKILDDNRQLFQTIQGSTNNHQAWPGGYIDHVQEIWNIALLLYPILKAARPLTFSLSDALVALFFHDIEKPWKYQLGADGQLHHRPELDSKEAQHAFKMEKIKEYGIDLTPEIENAIKYAEGELGDYSGRRRAMSPMAAFCHMCDIWSARGWYDYPQEEADPWTEAGRFRQ